MLEASCCNVVDAGRRITVRVSGSGAPAGAPPSQLGACHVSCVRTSHARLPSSETPDSLGRHHVRGSRGERWSELLLGLRAARFGSGP